MPPPPMALIGLDNPGDPAISQKKKLKKKSRNLKIFFLPGGILGLEALTAAEAKAQFLIQQHKIENRITPMNNTISKAINAAKFGSRVSTKLVDSSVLAAGTIL